LAVPDTALYDRRSKSSFGTVRVGDDVEVEGHRIRIVGEFELGTDFADDANLLVGERTFEAVCYNPHMEGKNVGWIDFGLVKLRPGADPEATLATLSRLLPEDAQVLTKAQYLQREADFWSAATPIGYIFGFGTAMGFIVGAVICYQVLFSDVADHLREF